ncbi:unnamed protein product [Durusdinium trenchii]|uniref:Uncharacterized protein n=1 Tax=Durusdinium trenchii TaxID=1381693 RepID=A0ABP0RDF9_9DINO
MAKSERIPGQDWHSDKDPGVPNYYFLRTSKPLRPKRLARSESGPHLSTAPVENQRVLCHAGRSTLRKPLSLASLAEDLAPAFHSESVEELPPGIYECRSKLEAFRSAAVEAISMEAQMQIEQQRKNAPSPKAEKTKPKRQVGYRPKPATEGPPGIDECRRKLLAFKEIVERAERSKDKDESVRWQVGN